MRSSADFGLVTLQTSVAVGCSPAVLDRDWAVYRVVPERIEFWQGSTSPEQDHVRLEYRQERRRRVAPLGAHPPLAVIGSGSGRAAGPTSWG